MLLENEESFIVQYLLEIFILLVGYLLLFFVLFYGALHLFRKCYHADCGSDNFKLWVVSIRKKRLVD